MKINLWIIGVYFFCSVQIADAWSSSEEKYIQSLYVKHKDYLSGFKAETDYCEPQEESSFDEKLAELYYGKLTDRSIHFMLDAITDRFPQLKGNIVPSMFSHRQNYVIVSVQKEEEEASN